MTKAKHRGPVHRGLRALLTDLRMTISTRRRVTGRSMRRVRNAPPPEIRHVGLVMADVVAMATAKYEPCPWGLSAGSCGVMHPRDHISKYAGATR